MNFLRNNSEANPSSLPTSIPTTSPQSDTPWLIGTAAKVVGTVAGLFSIMFGFFSLFSIFNTSCIFAGGLLMMEGILMSLIEAPCFCTFLDFAYMPSNFFDAKPHWIKATLYLCFAVVPFFWCIGVTTFFSCGLIFVTCALYLLIALGKKANVDEMRMKANNLSTSPSAILVNNEELPKSSEPAMYTKPKAMGNMFASPTINSTQAPVY